MHQVTSNFKFALGQMVVTKAGMELREYQDAKTGRLIGFPIIMLVQERHLVECPGGIQNYYSCRDWRDGKTMLKFNEIELANYDANEVLSFFAEIGSSTKPIHASETK